MFIPRTSSFDEKTLPSALQLENFKAEAEEAPKATVTGTSKRSLDALLEQKSPELPLIKKTRLSLSTPEQANEQERLKEIFLKQRADNNSLDNAGKKAKPIDHKQLEEKARLRAVERRLEDMRQLEYRKKLVEQTLNEMQPQIRMAPTDIQTGYKTKKREFWQNTFIKKS